MAGTPVFNMADNCLQYCRIDKVEGIFNAATNYILKMCIRDSLRRLSRDYPNIKAASAEIINLKAILALPKGTEYFLSDLHGEHEAFIHMIKSASGTIKMKIDEHFEVLGEKEREDLASLIYNAEAEIERRKKTEEDFDQWCSTAIRCV